MSTLSYTYRRFPPDARPEQIEARLNEARAGGWELHTFTDETDAMCASAVFKWTGLGLQCLPFADDVQAAEESEPESE